MYIYPQSTKEVALLASAVLPKFLSNAGNLVKPNPLQLNFAF